MTTKRIGLIQTRGIGDIIIALPIADYYLEQGCEVFWPIDEHFLAMFQRIKPAVRFLPVPRGPDFFLEAPFAMLRELGCDSIISLYSYLSTGKGFDAQLSAALKFDEYKYAIANVPFARKWTLQYERDLPREQALYDQLDIQGPYICTHAEGSNVALDLNLPPQLTDGFRVIPIDARTDSPFDWLLTLERASKLVLLDSCFSNLADQMNLANEKYLIVRSPAAFTPVYKNGWRFICLDLQPAAK